MELFGIQPVNNRGFVNKLMKSAYEWGQLKGSESLNFKTAASVGAIFSAEKS